MKWTLPSSTTTLPLGCHFMYGSSRCAGGSLMPDDLDCELCDAGGSATAAPTLGGALAVGLGAGAPSLDVCAYCLSSSSHLASRSCRSWLGRRRFLAGAGVLGMQ